MERSSFFNSVSGDRRYKAEDWAAYFAAFIGNGVFPMPSSNLQVVAQANMDVTLREGAAWINGYHYRNLGDLTLTLPIADGVLNRIDRIVLRWDQTDRSITARVKSSKAASSPTAPELQRDADAYELCLADVFVPAGSTAVQGSQITDQRLDSTLCGVVASVVKTIDTTEFNRQLREWFKEHKIKSKADYEALAAFFEARKIEGQTAYDGMRLWFSGFQSHAEREFRAWFDALREVLDENAETKILSIVTNLTDRVGLLESVVFNGDIEANPYLIQFDNLQGLTVTGVWNETLRRMEC